MASQPTTRKYLTFNELLERWQWNENELRSAILRADLKPSVRIHSKQPLLVWKLDLAGNVTAIELDDWYEPSSEQWLYLQDPIRTTQSDCEFRFATDDRDAIKTEVPLSNWIRLPVPMSIDDIRKNGVFLLAEVEGYEAAYLAKTGGSPNDKPLGKRERDTLLKIILGMAMSGYGFDPNAAKSDTPNEISRDLSLLKLDVTDETVRKYLKEAAATFLSGKPRQVP